MYHCCIHVPLTVCVWQCVCDSVHVCVCMYVYVCVCVYVCVFIHGNVYIIANKESHGPSDNTHSSTSVYIGHRIVSREQWGSYIDHDSSSVTPKERESIMQVSHPHELVHTNVNCNYNQGVTLWINWGEGYSNHISIVAWCNLIIQNLLTLQAHAHVTQDGSVQSHHIIHHTLRGDTAQCKVWLLWDKVTSQFNMHSTDGLSHSISV